MKKITSILVAFLAIQTSAFACSAQGVVPALNVGYAR